jgi:hypothetical protein
MKRMTKIILILMTVLLLSVVTVGELNDIDGKGTIAVSVRCAHNLFSKEVIIAPIGNFQTGFFGDETTLAVTLNPSGKYEGRFYPGNYRVYLLDGNGGHPEVLTTLVNSGYQSVVPFIGHAVSGDPTIERIPPCWKTCYIDIVPGGSYEHRVPCNETCPERPIVTPTVTPTITPTPVPTPTPCVPDRIWHEGYWETERQWKCGNRYAEESISCCYWQNVPVWHDGYYESVNNCEV